MTERSGSTPARLIHRVLGADKARVTPVLQDGVLEPVVILMEIVWPQNVVRDADFLRPWPYARLRPEALMRTILVICAVVGLCAATASGQSQPQPVKPDADVQSVVGRLDLERYKATVKGLTQFGDRRQGTERNRKAVDWIEAQLKSYGCPTERLKYEYSAPPAKPGGGGGGGGAQRPRPDPTIASGEVRTGPGGSRHRGVTRETGVNSDPDLQPDEKLRELNREPAADGPREQVYCTKVGATRPNEMYIIGAHMDGHGWGEAANDNGSGTALVMELARILSMPDVTSDVTIRFALWNNEETGLNGARAYVDQRQALQGKEDPAGSGRYPEPRWLGMIQHDMMMWDHGMPRPDGSYSPEQRPKPMSTSSSSHNRSAPMTR